MTAHDVERLRERAAALREGPPLEYVRALRELAGVASSNDEKAQCWAAVAEIYFSQFANEAEAVAAYEKAVALSPANLAGWSFLDDAYFRRRNYEKLVALRSRRAAGMQGAARLSAYKDVARLASERLRRSELTVQLWETVLALDPNDEEARAALRARSDPEPRASVWARVRRWLGRG